jgi:hypothetical protein
MIRKGYQRRTTTGIERRTKTVRGCTGKTPRNIVPACASTSASVMVRFFFILLTDIKWVSLFVVQRKYFFQLPPHILPKNVTALTSD